MQPYSSFQNSERAGGGEGGVGVGGGNGAVLVFENSILLIRVQGYRGLTEKWKTVKTVHNLRYSALKIREYFRGVVYCASFGIYGAAYLCIWCSVPMKILIFGVKPIETYYFQFCMSVGKWVFTVNFNVIIALCNIFCLCWGHIIRNWVMEGDGCVCKGSCLTSTSFINIIVCISL